MLFYLEGEYQGHKHFILLTYLYAKLIILDS